MTRRDFEAVVGGEIERARRGLCSLTLVTFAVQSDTADAPEIVETLTAWLSADIRETDLLLRLDAATIALALLDTDARKAGGVIARQRHRLDTSFMASSTCLSIGSASCPADADSLTALTHHAMSAATPWPRGAAMQPSLT